MTKPEWWPSWEGETVVIVASGPSAKNAPLHVAKGKAKFIAINKSWELAPWADILYGCDFAWWKHVKGCPGFSGLKLTVDRAAVKDFPELKQVECRKPDDRLFLSPLGTVGWGGNGGFHALNLAVQFGCRKIILVGYDMTTRYGLHWHGAHTGNLHNPKEASVARWRRAVDNASKVIHPMGIKVINCSKVSALTSYPKMELDKALVS